MRAYLENDIILIHHEDLPRYKKGGSVVRNSYFWALKSIACYTPRNGNWEFDSVVWVALCRILLAFCESGYLGYQETCLEFAPEVTIPQVLQSVSTWL